MAYLGRGRSHLTFLISTVVKEAPAWEPRYMQRFPEVFVPVLHIAGHSYVMPRLLEPDVQRERRMALEGGLPRLRALWQEPGIVNTEWRHRLEDHIRQQISKHALAVDLAFLDRVIDQLPPIGRACCIHGDPTLANIVRTLDGQWLWIDPLDRPYIPGDPHVDLGKLFQSCYDYEQVLCGDNDPRFDWALASSLAAQAGLDLHVGYLWMLIHLVRLLPYQDSRVREVYEAVLQREAQ